VPIWSLQNLGRRLSERLSEAGNWWIAN
jgi:hypothetical protein